MPDRVTAYGDNVTDATRIQALQECTESFILLQDAAEAAKKMRAEHSNRLKKWKSNGLNLEALKRAVKDRLIDPEDILKELHEYTRLRAVQNMPNIQQDLAELWNMRGALDIDAELEAQRTRWRDDGALAGRQGIPREENPHEAGSEAYECYDKGWLSSVERIAGAMGRGEPPAVNTSRTRRGANGAARTTSRRAPPADDKQAAE